MTRFCSDISGHMRLFELLRQQNLATERRDRDASRAAPSHPAEMDRFLSQAVQSLSL